MMSNMLNDLHAQLNATRATAVVRPRDVETMAAAVHRARSAGLGISISGGRHAMGGQQFGAGTLHIDTRDVGRVLALDLERGVVTVEAGIQWPALVGFLRAAQYGRRHAWAIVQKQTGADNFCLGGSLSSNIHGRGLTLKPLVDQIESFDLIGPDGVVRRCSRSKHADLFQLAIGGYGLFGIIARVALRLGRRVNVRRVVAVGDTAGLMERFAHRVRSGFLYGDFQFAIDDTSDDFLRRGVFACYEPVPYDVRVTERPVQFSAEDWTRLTCWAHTDKRRAFDFYAHRYLETQGQVYSSDAQFGAAYVDRYHATIDRALGGGGTGSEMITELFVPRRRLEAFLADARALLRDRRANVIYGTIRVVEQDDETVLAWARDPWACVVLNLHVDHTPQAIAHAAGTFRALIDLAIDHDGSYYLTYHRWARPDQLRRCYPRCGEFAEAKRRYDPDDLFQSAWSREVLPAMRTGQARRERVSAPARLRRALSGAPDPR